MLDHFPLGQDGSVLREELSSSLVIVSAGTVKVGLAGRSSRIELVGVCHRSFCFGAEVCLRGNFNADRRTDVIAFPRRFGGCFRSIVSPREGPCAKFSCVATALIGSCAITCWVRSRRLIGASESAASRLGYMTHGV